MEDDLVIIDKINQLVAYAQGKALMRGIYSSSSSSS